MISVNPFYLEFVPFERTDRAIRYSLEVFEQNTMVYQLEYYRRFKQYGLKTTLKFEDYIRLEGPDRFLRDVEFFPMGRAPYALQKILQRYYPLRSVSEILNQTCLSPPLRPLHNTGVQNNLRL